MVCRHDAGNFSSAAGMQRAGKAALKVCEEPDGPYFYAVALEQDQELIAGLEQELASGVQTASEPEQSVAPAEMDSSVAKDAFEALAARVQGISYARMAAKRMTACRQKSGSWSRR